MGKLRDWWPSEDLLERKNSVPPASAGAGVVGGPAASTASSPSYTNSYNPTSSPPATPGSIASAGAGGSGTMSAASVLRLSEVAAALNSMPCTSSSSSQQLAASQSAPQQSSAGQSALLSRPVIKLSNTQEHKDELLKKLLSKSASSSDLQNLNGTVSATKSGGSGGGSAAKSDRSAPALSGSPSDDSAPDHLYRNKRIKRSGGSNASVHNTSLTLQTSPNLGLEQLSKDSLSRREIHIYSERQRRKGMTHLYTILHSLLPDAKPKTDRCTVLTEAMDYIHELQRKVEDLRRHRASLGEQLNMEAGDQTGGGMDEKQAAIAELGEEAREQILAAADVVVRFCGKDAFITLNSPKKRGVWSSILQILNENHLELLNVTLSTSNAMDYHCIHAKISASSEIHSHELQKLLQDVVLSHAVILEE